MTVLLKRQFPRSRYVVPFFGGEVPYSDVAFGEAGCDLVLLRIKVETVHTVVGVKEGVHCDARGCGLWAQTDLFPELTCHVDFCFDVNALAVIVSEEIKEWANTMWEGGLGLLRGSLLLVLV